MNKKLRLQKKIFIFIIISLSTFNFHLIKTSKKGSKTVFVYMSARNDLNLFSGRNLSEMQLVGSNENLKIIAQLDTQNKNKQNVTKRLFIEKNRITQIGQDLSLDSGNPNNLIEFFSWGIKKYPAQEYILILWNHGTGIIEPNVKKAINPSQLFSFNFSTKLIELNRSVGFLDYINSLEQEREKLTRGICFDDTTGNYLTNQKLKYALGKITQELLNGQKIVLCCDACLMAGIEVIDPLRDYVKYFIGSQEVVLGTGYNYSITLKPLLSSNYSIQQFGRHIVSSFQDTYGRITNDYTQSAVNMSNLDLLVKNISELSKMLIFGINNQKKNSVKEMIRLSRHKNYCTHFDEPSYIDIGHFYQNLLSNINIAELNTAKNTGLFKNTIINLVKDVVEQNGILKKIIIANVAGKNLMKSTGLSIYFPENHIHSSYLQSEFAQKTAWLEFLNSYLKIHISKNETISK